MDATLTVDPIALQKLFHELPDRVARVVSKKAVAAGGRVVLDAAHAEVPVHKGTLKASLGQKDKVYPETDIAVSVIGARVDLVEGKAGYHHHLVHEGHVAADGSLVTGNPYLKRATDRVESAAYAVIASTLDEGIQQEARKL